MPSFGTLSAKSIPETEGRRQSLEIGSEKRKKGLGAPEPSAPRPDDARGLDPSQPPLSILLLSSLLVSERGHGKQRPEECLRRLGGDLARHPRSRPFDLLVVAGDMADRGSLTELERAEDLLRHFIARMGSPPPMVMLVPGNHDVSRGKAWWRPSMKLGSGLDEAMQSRKNQAVAKESVDGFRRLVERLHRDGLVPCEPVSSPYLLLGHEFEHHGRRVMLRGLDSAWGLPWSGQETGLLGTRQIQAALAGLEHADLRIAVLHYPPDKLDPAEWAVLQRSFHLVLTGPTSDPQPSCADGAVVVPSPSLSGGFMGGSTPGYVVLELGATAQVQVRWLDPSVEPVKVTLPLVGPEP